MTQARILFAHGSRDPGWAVPIESVAAKVAASRPDWQVATAYLELQSPDLPTVVENLVDRGATRVTITPMFLGTGRHAREDLPALVAALRLRFPRVAFELQPAIGEDDRVLQSLATAIAAYGVDATNRPPAP